MRRLAELRHRMVLEAPVDADDGAGGTLRTWQAVGTLWAGLEALLAEERVAAGRIEAAAGHRVTIRRRAGLSHEMRFVLGGRVFEIRGIADDGRSALIDCLCEEIAP